MEFVEKIKQKAKSNLKTIVLPEAEEERNLKAADRILSEGFAKLILIGNPEKVHHLASELYLENIAGAEIVDPNDNPKKQQYVDLMLKLRASKGLTAEQAEKLIVNPLYLGALMVKAGDADGMVSGANHSTADTVRPALQIIKSAKKGRAVSSAVLEVVNGKPYILSDCAIVINPTAAELADIAVDAAQTALQFGIEPNVALLSYSTKGSGKGEGVDKVAEAARLAGEQLKLPEYKDLPIKIDGEMQADAALDAVVAAKKAPGSEVAGQANVLIFPDIEAGNISYKLLQRLGGAEAYGPILQGLNAPVNDLSRGALVEDIVGMIAITALQAAKK